MNTLLVADGEEVFFFCLENQTEPNTVGPPTRYHLNARYARNYVARLRNNIPTFVSGIMLPLSHCAGGI